MKKKQLACLILILVLLALLLGMAAKIFKLNAREEANISLEMKKDDLYLEIEKAAGKYQIEPIDAKADQVWKAIPGYNGLKVDIEASYKNMKVEGKFDEERIVYLETPPRIHLDDLEPQPIYRGNPQKPMVAFLINVAWGNEYIPGILEALKEHEVKSTFFFDGSWTKKNPDLAKLIHGAGHEIGNHAYSHPDLNLKSRSETAEELQRTNAVIEETLGIKVGWFAPPSGSFNQETVKVAHELGMKTIMWTVDTVDWRKPATTEIVNRVLSKIENGAMVLMHPTKPTGEGIGKMIAEIKKMGYQLGTVSDLMSEKRVP